MGPPHRLVGPPVKVHEPAKHIVDSAIVVGPLGIGPELEQRVREFDAVPRDVISGIWLLTYGAGLSACGVFSIPVVMIAGGAFIGLGAVTLTAPPSWSPMLLAAGFGLIHIVLGFLVMRRHGG